MKSRLFARILPFAAPLFSGALLVLGFPNFNLYFLPWVAIVPLFYALSGRRPLARALISYLFGVCFFGILFYWFCHARSPAWMGYLGFLIVIPVIFIPWGMIAGWALDRRSPLAIFIPALGWVALELLMSYGTFAFPWWSLALSQAENLVLLQLASITGMYGISFFVLMSNAILYKTLAGRAGNCKVPFAVTGVLFAASLFYGATALLHKPPTQRKPMRMAMVQPSFGQEQKLDAIEGEIVSSLDHMYDVFWSMTMTATSGAHDPDVIVWPESVLPDQWLLEEDMSPRPETGMRLKLAGATLITGVFIDNYNSVIGISEHGRYLGRYDKMQLVPGGEFVPWREELSKFPALKKWLDNAVYQDDTARGNNYQLIKTEYGRVGPLICFESMVPHIARSMTRNGAEMLLVVTNDAWFKFSPAAAQHVALARLRAIENRRWLAQSSNSGLTVIVDPNGRITATSRLFERQNIHGSLYPRTDITFYTKHGDVFGLACVVLFLAGIFLIALQDKLDLGIRGNPCGDAELD